MLFFSDFTNVPPRLPAQLAHQNQHFLLTPLKKAKNFRLRYNTKENKFCVTVPTATTKKEVEDFLQRADRWLKEKTPQYKEKIILLPGQEIPILGKNSCIFYQKDIREKISFEGNAILIYSPKKDYGNLLKNGLKNKALEFLQAKSHDYARFLGVSLGKISVKDLYSRWGSCSFKGDLSYAWRLIFAPLEVCDYICAHEVSHRLYMDHGKNFWQTVKRICPNYKSHRLWMNQYGRQLFKYEFPEILPEDKF